jgi:S-adenosylmethionine-diacylglycerol 3-amino-3-carboxypropyl transferase
MTAPAWLTQAISLPVAFAQVREDPLLDETLVALSDALNETLHKSKARICMIASGGCTVAALAALPNVELLHCVDPNPAQLALAQIKLSLLRDASIDERLLVLGHHACDPATRATAITHALARAGQQDADLGPPDLLSTLGLDHIGRYERLFAALRVELQPVAENIGNLLMLADPVEQRRSIQPDGMLWHAIESAFLKVMALPNLVALFGESATRNPVEAFPRHFLRRLRWAIESLPARTNPFLAQLLCGDFVPGQTHRWIGLPCPARLPVVTWEQAYMVPALQRQPRSFDLIHLSNILDWLSPAEARETLAAARMALRPGGRVIVRQLNSSLDIPALGDGLRWDQTLGESLLQQDRSFFYRQILVGCVP